MTAPLAQPEARGYLEPVPTLAERYGTDADLRTMLRDSVGHPNQTVLLPDRSVEDAMFRALDELNADFPVATLGTFQAVAGQQVYGPLPATALGWRRVWWPVPASCGCELSATLDALSPFFGPADDWGTRVLPDPSLVMAYDQQLAWLKRLRGGGYVLVDRSVYLDPVPDAVATVFFSYNAPRFLTPGAVFGRHVRPYLSLCEALLHERLATGAGAIESVTDGDQNSSTSTAAARNALALARSKRHEYMRSRPPIDLGTTFP